jgi:uncharacterized protein YegJ (DUF2314 family)
VEHAVYMAAPVPAAQLERAKREVRARFPDVPLVSEPKDPPGVMIGAPDIATYAPPGEDSLVHSGRGLSPEAAKAAAASKGALLLSWAFDDDPKLARLRATQVLAADLADSVGGFVWDQATREVYTVAAFRAARVETWQGDVPDVQRHFTIHYYATGDGRHRAITLGLEKLGLPDLVIQDVPQRSATPASTLMNVLAQLLVEGASIGPGGRVVVDLASIAHAGARERASSDLLGKPARRATLDLVMAEREEGDPDNRLVELRFAAHQGATEVERLLAALDALFGSQDDATLRPTDDPELAAVTRRVQAKLPELAAMFRKGLPLNDRFLVKAPFDTDDGSVEWMWISVNTWPGDVLVGHLENDPFSIAALKAGARVEVKQSSVADYIWNKADGSQEGGESIPILRRRSKGSP